MPTTRIGKLGEQELSRWAAKSDIICTQTSDDRRGWDFLLEIPTATPAESLAPSSSVEDLQCFVQVKSTRRDVSSWSVTLSNWKRLVETALPAFFLVLRFNDRDECTDAFLSHVGESEISRVVDRIWELAISDKPLRLHKHKMQLSWGVSERLREPSGEALRARILASVGDCPSTYAKRKAELKRESGHSKGRGKATLRIAVPDEYRERHPDEFLVDVILGLIPFPDVVGGEIKQVQFPIPSVTSHKLSGESRVKLGLPRPAMIAQLELTASDREHRVVLPAEMRGPGGLALPVHPSAWKLLFTLPHAKLVIESGSSTGRFHFDVPDLEEATCLSDAMHLVRLLRFVEAVHAPVDVDFGGHRVATLDFTDSRLDQDLIRWMNLVGAADAACSEFGLPDDITFTTRDLLEQQCALDSLAIALPGCEARSPAFTFSLDEGSPEPVQDEQMCMPIYVELLLGTRRVVAFETLLGTYRGERSEAGDFAVRVDRAVIEKALILAPDESLPRERISYLNEIADRRSTEGGVLCWWRRRGAINAPAD